jgi:hypothetical protein
MRFKFIAAIAAGLITAGLSAGADAEVRTETFDYKQASTTLEGYVAWDDAVKGKRPGVLVFPTYTAPPNSNAMSRANWPSWDTLRWSPTSMAKAFTRQRARKLAPR